MTAAMTAHYQIEQAVADALPHDEDCGEHVLCHCGVSGKRAKLLLHVSNHVERLTRGRVYIDR